MTECSVYRLASGNTVSVWLGLVNRILGWGGPRRVDILHEKEIPLVKDNSFGLHHVPVETGSSPFAGWF